jgi:glycosyltransferase involved in cell wall biosynthesis
MIRVLHIVGTMDLGGIEQFIMNVYRNIDREKVQFDFIVHKEEKNYFEDEIHELGGRVFRVPRKSSGIIKNMAKMYTILLRNQGYEIVHIHNNSALCLTDLIVAKLCKTKFTIVHSHSTSTAKRKKILNRIFRPLMIKFADKKLACSDLAAQWLFGKTSEVIIINNAIDAIKFKYNEQSARKYRTNMGIHPDTVLIGHIGNFSYAKNHMFLIDIFKSVVEINKNSKLILVGQGPLQKDVINKVVELNLEDYVIFAGLRKDIPEILSAVDVLLFPSLYEGFPVTLVEAQSAGLKCIISDTITKQVVLTDLVEQLSLKESPDRWAEKVLSSTKRYNRKNTYQEIMKKGFDVKEEAKRLQNFYLKLG